jgi:hypothetical protein
MNRVNNKGHETVALPANRRHHLIARILVGAAVALGSGIAGAIPASADPNPAVTDPNPFAALGCDCRQTAPAGSPAARQEVDRGIRAGLYSSLPELPAPAQPSQPRP